MRELARDLETHQTAACVVAIAVGLGIGLVAPGLGESLDVLIYPALGLLLFVTFLQVPFTETRTSSKDKRFLGTILLINFVVVPPLAWALSRFVTADTAIELGVLMVLLTPCIDYVIAFTRLAGGDHRRLLVATPVLMLLQIALLPAYLWLFMGSELAALIEAGPFIETFLLLIVIPLTLAWTAEILSRSNSAVDRGREIAVDLPAVLMAATLLIVVASQSPRALDDIGRVAATIPLFAGFAIIMALVGARIAKSFLPDAGRARAATFSGVTRNGLVVLPLALALEVDSTLTAAVIVTQVLVEVTALVMLVRLAPRLLPEHQPRG